MNRFLLSTFVLLVCFALAKADLFVGTWEIEDAHLNRDNLVLSTDKPITVAIKQGDEPETYKLFTRVSNRFSGTIKVTGKSHSGDIAHVQVSSMTSTRMMPPPELADAENFVSTKLPLITVMEIKQDKLLLIGKDKSGTNIMVRCHSKLEGSS